MIVSSLFSLLFACQNPPPVPGTLERTGEVLTTVNGQAITQGMVDGMLSQFPADVRDRVIAQGQQAVLLDGPYGGVVPVIVAKQAFAWWYRASNPRASHSPEPLKL